MNMKKVRTWAIMVSLSFVLCGTWAAELEPTISVLAKQRYPWNGLVDVKFTIAGEAGKKYATSFTAMDLVGNTNITMKTIYKSKDVPAQSPENLASGSYSWIWDASKDLPMDWESARVSVVGEAKNVVPLYIAIDLSAGKDATSYPIEYIYETPSAGWTDEYKTTKLVMRRIEPGTFMMGEGGRFNVSLATPYYIGVFETTQQQYELVTGNNPSLHKGRLLPVGNVSWNEIRGDADVHDWPSVITVDPYSFIGLLQARSKLQIDLPTESQWEYACRAGTTTSYSYGEQSNGDYMWYYENSGLTTHDVGGRLANAWGLYDMHGNVYEWCLERFVGSLSTGAEASSVDPSLRSHRMLRGGSWNSIVGWCYSYTWISLNPNSSGDDCGFRLAIHLAE